MNGWLKALNDQRFERVYWLYSNFTWLMFAAGLALLAVCFTEGANSGFISAYLLLGTPTVMVWLLLSKPITNEKLRRKV